MKKLVSIALCLVLSLSIIATVGCGEKSAFDGNYKESSVTEVQTFAEKVDATENDEQLGFSSGFNLNLATTVKLNDSTVKMDANLKSALTDEKLQMSGGINATIPKDLAAELNATGDVSINASVYLNDGNIYFSVDGKNLSDNDSFQLPYKGYISVDTIGSIIGGIIGGGFLATDTDDLIGDFDNIGGIDGIGGIGDIGNIGDISGIFENFNPSDLLSISYIVEMLNELDDEDVTAKFYLDDGKTEKKFKAEVTDETNKLSVVFVYDANYKMTALKIEVSGTYAVDEETAMGIDFVVTLKQYSGSIKLPKDLDTYKDLSTQFGGFGF